MHDLTLKHLSYVRLAYRFSFNKRTIALFICHCLLWWKVTFLTIKRCHLGHSTVISSGIFTTTDWIHLQTAKHHHLHWIGTYSRFQCCRKLNKLSYNFIEIIFWKTCRRKFFSLFFLKILIQFWFFFSDIYKKKKKKKIQNQIFFGNSSWWMLPQPWNLLNMNTFQCLFPYQWNTFTENDHVYRSEQSLVTPLNDSIQSKVFTRACKLTQEKLGFMLVFSNYHTVLSL